MSLLVLLLTGFTLRAQPTAGRSSVVGATQDRVLDQFTLNQCVLMADGSTRQVPLALPRRYMLNTFAHCGTRHLYLLRKQFSDSTALLLTDSLGQVMQLKRMGPKLPNAANSTPPQLIGLSPGRGFVLFLPTKKAHRVLCLTADIATSWTGELPAQPLLQLLASETHLWVLQQKQVPDSKAIPLVHTFDLTTGAQTFSGTLQHKDQLEAATLVPEGLLVAGSSLRKFVRPLPAGQPLPRTKWVDFVQVIKPNGQNHLTQALVWPASQRPEHHWQAVAQRPDGSYQLIGQTFRRVPNVTAFALAAVGGAFMAGTGTGFLMRGNYVDEQPTGLVQARLLPSGQLADVQMLTVPAAMTNSQPVVDTLAAPRSHSAAFSSIGFSPDQRFLLLSTEQQVLLYEPDRHELRALTAPRPTRPTVLAIRTGQTLVGWPGPPDRACPDYKWVSWP